MENVSLLWCTGHPVHDLLKEEFAGSFHTAEVLVIACFNGFEPSNQKLLLRVLLSLFGLHEFAENALSRD
jgi:hypothetical protein